MGNRKRLRTLEWKNEQLRKAEKEYFRELLKSKKEHSDEFTETNRENMDEQQDLENKSSKESSCDRNDREDKERN